MPAYADEVRQCLYGSAEMLGGRSETVGGRSETVGGGVEAPYSSLPPGSLAQWERSQTFNSLSIYQKEA
jgi:hypothetical protein